MVKVATSNAADTVAAAVPINSQMERSSWRSVSEWQVLAAG
jgi:chemotaxis regulatin CheY-phosphate phosphatase CheZ